MNTTLGALVTAEPALRRLAAQSVSFKATRHLDKLTKQVEAETALFHQKHRALVLANGVQRAATVLETIQGVTGPITEVPVEKRAEFAAQIEEMSSEAVTLEAIDKWLLTPDMLAEFKISREDLVALGALVQSD